MSLPDAITSQLAALPAIVRQHLPDRRTARELATRRSPLLFAYVYLRHHLRDDAGQITASQFHLDVARYAARWMAPVEEAGTERDAFVAPRGCGKSTWLFLILPMWAAAHGHKKFVAAFAHSGPQAEQHLSTFRNELENNELLRADFPELCEPKLRARGATVADRDKQTTRANGFTFAARGIDEGVLGMKVEQRRPDLIVLDDVEPDEAAYSLYQVGKRLGTLLDAILPINIRAHVVLAGTTTIAGGIVHQLIQHELGEDVDSPAEWIDAEKFRVHYYPAIMTDARGEEYSLWPAKWTLDYLQSIRHTRSYAKNMDNRPVAVNGAYWTDADLYEAGELPTTRRLLSLDPAVTSTAKSDYTGAAVLGLVPATYLTDERGRRKLVTPTRVVVERTWHLRMTPGEELRNWVLAQLAADPAISVVLVETNQGGEVWATVLHDLPPGVRLMTVHQHEPKEVRAARLLAACQRRRVLFRGKQLPFRTEALAFPNTAHDDVIDAVGSGVHRMIGKKNAAEPTGTTAAYVA
ncbi:MAG TPA: hypothetical protein VM430_18920 [Microbacterium sp.]|nr:hypothetical protein [Microbacterium sp.]